MKQYRAYKRDHHKKGHHREEDEAEHLRVTAYQQQARVIRLRQGGHLNEADELQKQIDKFFQEADAIDRQNIEAELYGPNETTD